jgi:hypothetical protein
MMKRAFSALAVAALAVLAFAAPASATTHVTQDRFSQKFADAAWATSSATSSTLTYIAVSKTTQGDYVSLYHFTSNLDADGNFTGATSTFLSATSGFSSTIQKSMMSASVSGPSLLAQTYTYDANYNVIDISDTIIGFNVAWTGQGPTSRDVFNNHYKSDGFDVMAHYSATHRLAAATGTVAGVTLSAGDLQFADLASTGYGIVTLCIGNSSC